MLTQIENIAKGEFSQLGCFKNHSTEKTIASHVRYKRSPFGALKEKCSLKLQNLQGRIQTDWVTRRIMAIKIIAIRVRRVLGMKVPFETLN